MSRSTAPGRPYLVRCTSAALATRVKSAIVFSLMVDGSVSRGCRIVPNRKRRCYQRRFGAPTRGTGPLRLALAGATRSGSAGVGSLARDPLATLRGVQVESIGTTINFRLAASQQIRLSHPGSRLTADSGRLISPSPSAHQPPTHILA